MTIYLVRHAKAGSRKNWVDDDTQRPLVKSGREQAQLLVQKFADVEVTRLISSPYVRCQQTLQPLAEARGLVVEVDVRLAENTSRGIVAELLGTVAEGTVLCSHGDVIPDVLGLFERHGMTLLSWCDTRKAATALMEKVDGVFSTVDFWAPPSA
jgi:8-oxo-dGTP diphosphatase